MRPDQADTIRTRNEEEKQMKIHISQPHFGWKTADLDISAITFEGEPRVRIDVRFRHAGKYIALELDDNTAVEMCNEIVDTIEHRNTPRSAA